MTVSGAGTDPLERTFGQDEIIVSKTDLKGIIIYANDVFVRISGYDEEELLGKPHNIVRHPDMPRCIYKLLWERIKSGNEIFAYVVNRAKNNDFYWVFAHVTPVFAGGSSAIGYHSSRRLPARTAVDKAIALYAGLRAEEAKGGMAAGTALLERILRDEGCGYDEFVFSL